jgi:hypothetical protein
MNDCTTRANIENLLNVLHYDHVSSSKRDVLNRQLIHEENQLSRTPEQLAFVERETARYREHYDHLMQRRDGFAADSPEWMRANDMATAFERTLRLMEGFCSRMREEVNGKPS